MDLTMKLRKNLHQASQSHIPMTTMNFDIDQFLFTVDEEFYKDVQYLTKFWSWHAAANQKDMLHYKFRPAYNVPIRGHAKKYWKYAIKSTIFYMRSQKKQQSGELKALQ